MDAEPNIWLFKPKPKNGSPAKNWHGAVHFPGEPYPTRRSLKTRDRRVAVKKLEELKEQLIRERSGGTLLTLSRAESQELLKLAHVFFAGKEARGVGEDHLKKTRYRLRMMFSELGWAKWSEISQAGVERWIVATRTGQGVKKRASKSIHELVALLKEFTQDVIDRGHASTNPLANLKNVPIIRNQSFSRRAYTLEELSAVHQASGAYWIGYSAFYYTGLRRKAVEGLKWSDLCLRDNPPYIVVRPEISKSGQREKVWVSEGLKETIEQARTQAESDDEFVFRSFVPSMAEHKRILKTAGLDYENETHERIDIHSLRHTFATLLAESDTPELVGQAALHHTSDGLFKMVYAHVNGSPLVKAFNSIPRLPTAPQESAVKPAVEVVPTSPTASQEGADKSKKPETETTAGEQDCHEMARFGAKGHNGSNGGEGRNRTYHIYFSYLHRVAFHGEYALYSASWAQYAFRASLAIFGNQLHEKRGQMWPEVLARFRILAIPSLSSLVSTQIGFPERA